MYCLVVQPLPQISGEIPPFPGPVRLVLGPPLRGPVLGPVQPISDPIWLVTAKILPLCRTIFGPFHGGQPMEKFY